MRLGRPPKSPKVTVTCEQCGKTWEAYAWNKDKSKYCSRECFYASRVNQPKVFRRIHWGETLHKPALQMSETEIAWMAGIFDGEGSIVWPRRKIMHSVALTVANTNERLMQKIISVTGTGRVTKKERKNKRHSQAWTWSCYGDNARIILKQLLPWLIIKEEAAQVALGVKEAAEPPWTQHSRTMRGSG